MRRIDSLDDIADGLVELARTDLRLARAIELSGPVPLRRKPPGYAALAEIILSQMVSKASANALWRKPGAPGGAWLRGCCGRITPPSCAAMRPPSRPDEGLARR